MTQSAPIKQKINEATGYLSRPWVSYFTSLTFDATAIGLNTIHRTSSGVDHGFIDQDVTITSSPTFAGLTVDGKDLIKWAVLQGG